MNFINTGFNPFDDASGQQLLKWLAIQGIIPEGGAGTTGTFTLNGTNPVTVNNANWTANSTLVIGLKTVGGIVSNVQMLTSTPGVGFTVGADSGPNSCVYNYRIFN